MRLERYVGVRLGSVFLYVVLGSLDFVLKVEESFEVFFFRIVVI